MVGAAFGLGFIIGPVIGGLLGQYGEQVPFYATAVLCFLNFLYGYFILPESLSKENRREFDIKRANPIGNFLNLKKHPKLIYLVLAMFIMHTASHAMHSNWSYFTMYQFNWDEKMVGISLGVVGFLVAIVQGGLVRWINPKIGNVKSVFIGFTLYCIGLLLFAFATKSWMMFAFLIPYCLGGIATPALQAIISNQVSDKEQGEIQGTLASVMSASTIVGPPLITGTFYYFTSNEAPFIFGGAPFILAFGLTVISTFIAFFALRKI